MYCYKCGAQIDDEAIVCTSCGCATKNYRGYRNDVQTSFEEDVSPKSRLVALLLSIFLGCLGVHRFYLGKVGTGIIWLLTFGCFGIGTLIDIIIIACGKATDKDNLLVLDWN